MLQTLVETGVRICNADRGAISPSPSGPFETG
jgi:hypothetical protein